VRDPAFEEIGFARTKDPDRVADRDLESARQDHAGFFAEMGQHVRTGVGAGFISIFHELQGVTGQVGANLPDCVQAEPGNREILPPEEGLAICGASVVDQRGDADAERQGELLQDSDRRTDGSAFDFADRRVTDICPGREIAHRKAAGLAELPQPLAQSIIRLHVAFP